jgi:hypothetical protein
MINIRHAVVQMRSGHWSEARSLVQKDNSLLGAWLHGILDIQEGDLISAESWYVKANRNFLRRGSVDEELKRFEAELMD